MPTPCPIAILICLLLVLEPEHARSQSTLTLDDFLVDDSVSPENHAALDLCNPTSSSTSGVGVSESDETDSIAMEDVLNLGIAELTSQDVGTAPPAACLNLGQLDPAQSQHVGSKILDLSFGNALNSSIAYEFLLGEQFAAIHKNHQQWHRYLVLGFSAASGLPAQDLVAARQRADEIAAMLSGPMKLDPEQILSIGLHPPSKSSPVGASTNRVAVYLLSRR